MRELGWGAQMAPSTRCALFLDRPLRKITLFCYEHYVRQCHCENWEVTGFGSIDSVAYDSFQSLPSRPEGACQLVPLQNADGGWLRSGNATFSDDKLYSC